MFKNHLISAKAIILLSVGVLVGHAIGRSLASDAAQGRSLTMKQYIADFDAHKAKLTSSEIPMPAAIIAGVVMLLGTFGAYELLALGLAKVFAAAERRLSPTPPPGPPA